ncbi:MAG: hypothetical protein JO107_05355 [Hyphomicrobiales bacterium]|nr:hypothetical protein [Hyphomicrobiales bacterium]
MSNSSKATFAPSICSNFWDGGVATLVCGGGAVAQAPSASAMPTAPVVIHARSGRTDIFDPQLYAFARSSDSAV